MTECAIHFLAVGRGIAAHAIVNGRLEDGTPYYGPLGEVRLSDDPERIQCHLCGRWYVSLAPAHLAKAHSIDHLEYRRLFGLTRKVALQTPGLRHRHREVMLRLLHENEAVQMALLNAQERMRSGALDHVARPKVRGPQRAMQRVRSAYAARAASRLRQRTADLSRLGRVRALGFESIEEFLRQRYLVERRSLREIQLELKIGQTSLYRLMRGARIIVRDRAQAAAATKRARRTESASAAGHGSG